MNASATLFPIEASPSELATQSQQPVAKMIQAVIDRGLTEQSVSVMERLLAMYEKMQEKDAERQFADAFNKMQMEMPVVNAVKAVPNKDGSLRYRFAPYEEIMHKARPIYQKHGFTVAFSMAYNETKITQRCSLQHVGGHMRTNEFTVRIGSGPPGSSEAQSDGAAATYAKRQALCDALNIVIEHDSDCFAEDKTICKEEAETLRDLVILTKSNEAAFLRYAGADSYEGILADRFKSLLAELQKKKGAK